MRNLILKQGDLVRYRYPISDLTKHGFTLGQVYEVYKDGLGLYVRPNKDAMGVSLVLLDGTLTESCECFNMVQCPIMLPKGNVS